MATVEIAHPMELLGASVTIGKDWHGEIDAVSIRRSGAVLYEVVWWDGSTRKSGYVAREEFTIREVVE